MWGRAEDIWEISTSCSILQEVELLKYLKISALKTALKKIYF